MIAIETNILIYAHRQEATQFEAATYALENLSRSGEAWAIPWPCACEFIAIVTGRAFGTAATPLPIALETIRSWTSHPQCSLLSENDESFELLAELAMRAKLAGGAIHDAKIAAICLSHHVSELWTADRDFQKFPDLRTRNPLVASLHEPQRAYTANLIT